MLLSQSSRVLSDATCLGPLGWRPHELVVFGSLFSWGGNVVEGALCANRAFLRRFLGVGPRRMSILGTLPAAVGSFGTAAGALAAAGVASFLQRYSWVWRAAFAMPGTGAGGGGIATAAAGVAGGTISSGAGLAPAFGRILPSMGCVASERLLALPWGDAQHDACRGASGSDE